MCFAPEMSKLKYNYCGEGLGRNKEAPDGLMLKHFFNYLSPIYLFEAFA